MPPHFIVTAVVLAYLLVNLLVGWAPGSSTSADADGYVAGDRSLGLVLMYFVTGATVFSAFAFLGAPGWAMSRGVAALYILAYGAVGFVPFYILGPRAARVGRRFGLVTQAEMVASRFGRRSIAAIMALVSLAAFVPYLALQMKGAGYVLEVVTAGAVPAWAGAAAVYAVVTVYVLRSGVLGVGFTNTLQGIFMMVLAWGLGLYLPYRLYGGVGPMFEAIAVARPELLSLPGLTGSGAPWTWGEYTSAIVVSAVGFSAWPHLFMKAFTAKDDRTIRRTVVLYPTFQIFLVPLFLIGFAGVLFTPAPDKPDQILPHMLMNLELSPFVVGLFCAGALAASMSSGDAMAHAAASIVVRDGVVRALGRTLDAAVELAAIRVSVVVVMVVSYAVAVVYEGSLVSLLLSAYGAVVQFMPALVATLCVSRASGRGVLAGLVGGAAVTIGFTLWPELRWFEVHAGAYGLAINVLLLSAVSWFDGPGEGAEWLKVASTEAPASGR